MSNFVPKKDYLHGILLYYFFMKNTPAETHRIPVEVCGEHALSERTCQDWLQRFKSGAFDVEDKARSGRPNEFDDKLLKALLDDDPCQTFNELAKSLSVGRSPVSRRLRAMGMIQK